MACIYSKQFAKSTKGAMDLTKSVDKENALAYLEEQLTELISQAKKDGATDEEIAKITSYYADTKNLKQFTKGLPSFVYKDEKDGYCILPKKMRKDEEILFEGTDEECEQWIADKED